MPKSDKRPYIENYPKLHKWLRQHAIPMWQRCTTDDEEFHDMIECWATKQTARVFMVLVYRDGNGWEIFTLPDPEDNKTNEGALKDAEKRLGLS